LITWVKTPRIGVFLISLESLAGNLSNWQFDSRPQKVRNRPNPDVRWRSVTWHWKALKESYKIGSDLVPIRGQGEKLWWPKVMGVQIAIVLKLHFGSPGTKNHLGVGVVEQCRRWGLPPSPGRGESSESKVARGLSQHQKGVEWILTNLWLVLDAGPCNKIIVPFPSLIPGLLTHPSYSL
jgi:hypothetical protein